MAVISDNVQSRWRACLPTSEQVKLTLYVTGEERTQVITPAGQMVPAGFDAPTAKATLISAAPGTLAPGTYYYVYVYASTRYPYVQNAQTTANGELWPRSNPSPISSPYTLVTDKTITVTATKTTQANVDKILVYRTTGHTDAAEALVSAQAGLYYYVGQVANNGSPGTITLTDNGLIDTGELLELDNYKANTAWFSVFDGKYWWMAGNPEFAITATLDGTSSVTTSPTETDQALFDGRNGQIATFDGVTDGGFDGQGSFYVGINSINSVTLYSDQELTATLGVNYAGSAKMRIRGRSSVLYRSKAFNPFSWGFTEFILNADGSSTTIPQSFALELGGGAVTAMAVSNNGKLLIIHFESPQRTISLDLELAESDQFGDTLKIIDDTNSVTAHFTQFHGLVGSSSILLGLDTYSGNVLACDGYRQTVISSTGLGDFMLSLDRTENAHRFFHGEFDPTTQLNCFWVRYYDTTEICNVLVWNHADSGQWGWTPDFNVSCSSVCQDPDTNERFIIGGTENGHVGRLFNTEFYDNWLNGIGWRNIFLVTSPSTVGSTYRFATRTIDFQLVTQSITMAAPGDSTFVTDGTPSMAVGDQIHMIETGDFVNQSQTVIAINGTTVTIDEPWTTDPVPDKVFVDAGRCNGLWSVISNAAGTNFWLVHLTSLGVIITEDDITISWSIDKYIERGTTEVLTPSGTPPFATNDVLFINPTPCLYRTFFDLNTPTKDKRASEIWTTVDNVDPHNGGGAMTYTGRFYQEFDEESTPGRTFKIGSVKRTPTSASNDSNVWLTKTGVPTSDLKQFGMEICQLGYEAFTLYNYTLKVKPD